MKRNVTLGLSGLMALLFALASAGTSAQESDWSALEQEIADIETERDLRLGVYLKDLSEEKSLSHRLDRDWYLASTIKIPLAIAVMQRVEEGELDLEQELELAETDFVDGSGELLSAEPGTRYSIEELNRRSVAHSDSTATDMLIRLLGEESFNQQIRERMIPHGFGPITTILQVRYEAYRHIHPTVENLTNLDFIDLKRAPDMSGRYQRLVEKLDIDAGDADATTVPEAFERYYQSDLNSGDLAAMGQLLERLVEGELLSEAGTHQVLDYMREVNTGDNRIKAGLPASTDFAHKTGTQIGRSCNVGIVRPGTPEKAIIVAACAEGYGPLVHAEQAFADLGRALTEHLLEPNQ